MRPIPAFAMLLLGGAAVPSAGAQNAEPAELPFAAMGGAIEDWRAAEDGEALLIEGRNGQWFRATFWGPCPAINFAQTIGFVTSEPTGSLDRFSSIFVDGIRCHFRTFERTTSPEELSEPRVEAAEPE